jgi:hypothetical protein
MSNPPNQRPRRVRSLVFLALLALGLSGCYYSPLPSEQPINVNGVYIGRLVGNSNDSAALDITLVEQDLAVTAVVKSRANAQTYILSGTRSVYTSSPVTVNITGTAGSGGACANGITDRYSVSATIRNGSGSARGQIQGSGTVEHQTCVGGALVRSDIDSGQLELTKK